MLTNNFGNKKHLTDNYEEIRDALSSSTSPIKQWNNWSAITYP